MLAGLNLRAALGGALPLVAGMFFAKLGAKRFGGGGSETDPTTWTWRTYLQALAGGAVGAIAINAIRPGWGQRVFTGAMALTLYKIVQNKLVSGNATAASWFGADNSALLDLSGDTPYLYGYGAQALPLDESHRMELPEAQVSGYGDDMYGDDMYGDDMYGDDMYGDDMYGEVLQPPGPMGEVLVHPGPLGADARDDVLNAYRASWT
jgi:hypothetical protein